MTREGPDRRRQPPAVHQGRGGLGAAAPRPRGGAGAHRPAFRRRALGGVLRRARPAGARSRAGHRARLEHLADLADACRARAGAGRVAPTRSSSTATRTRRSPARSPAPRPGSRWPTSRRGCARSTARCPRSSTACSPTTPARCCCAPRRSRSRTCARDVAGTVELVGDVMVDVAMAIQPRARERTDLVRPAASRPAQYVLATAHRAGNVDSPSGCGRWSSCCWRCRRRWCCRCTRAPRRGCATPGCTSSLERGDNVT